MILAMSRARGVGWRRCRDGLVWDYLGWTTIERPLKKRCRILPTGGLGVSPSFKKSPKIGGLGG